MTPLSMAIYHLNASTGSQSGGQSAAAKVDYIARAGRYREGRSEVALIESAHMPDWVNDGTGRAAGAALDYWRQADKNERANGVLYRQVEFALPIELSTLARQELARKFAESLSQVSGGNLPYTLAIHEKPGNPHAHLVLSERINDGISRDRETWFKRAAASPKGRALDPAIGGARKADIGSRRKKWLEETREQWADIANQALRMAKVDAFIHPWSHQALGLRRLPGVHLGPNARNIDKKSLEKTGIHGLRVMHINARKALDAVDYAIPSDAARYGVDYVIQRRPLPSIKTNFIGDDRGAILSIDMANRQIAVPKRTQDAAKTLETALVRRRVMAIPNPVSLLPLTFARLTVLPPLDAVLETQELRTEVLGIPFVIPTLQRSGDAEIEINKALAASTERSERTRSELIERRNRAFGIISQQTSEIERRSNECEQEKRRTDETKPGVRAVFVGNQRQLIEISRMGQTDVWRKPEVIEASSRTQCVDQTNGQLDKPSTRRREALLSRGDRLGEAFNRFVSAARERAEKLAAELEKKPSFSELFDEWMGKLKSLFGPNYSPLKERDEVEGKVIGRLEYEGEVAIAVRRYGQEWTVAKGVDYPEGDMINIKSRNGVIQGVSVQSLGQRESIRR